MKSKDNCSLSKTKLNESNEQSESVSNNDQIEFKSYLTPVLGSNNESAKWNDEIDDEYSFSRDLESIDEKDKVLIRQYEYRFR